MPAPRRAARIPRPRVAVRLLLVCGLTALAAPACSSTPAAPTALPACKAAEPAVLPHTAGSLTQADTGTYCLGADQVLDVFLTAPATSGAHGRWSQIAITDTSVLGYGNNGVMTPPLDVTPGVVVGIARGTSKITSTLPDGSTWTATIVVS